MGEHVRLWDTDTWQRSASTAGAPVAVALFSPDGAWLVTGQTNGERLVLWERANLEAGRHLPGHARVCRHHMRNAIAFSPDGEGADDAVDRDRRGRRRCGPAILEASPRSNLRASVPRPNMLLACAAFEPRRNHLFTGTWDGRLVVWDLDRREPQARAGGREHSTHITRIAVAPGGKRDRHRRRGSDAESVGPRNLPAPGPASRSHEPDLRSGHLARRTARSSRAAAGRRHASSGGRTAPMRLTC